MEQNIGQFDTSKFARQESACMMRCGEESTSSSNSTNSLDLGGLEGAKAESRKLFGEEFTLTGPSTVAVHKSVRSSGATRSVFDYKVSSASDHSGATDQGAD